MSALTPQNGRATAVLTYSPASAGGDTVANKGSQVELLVRNASAGSINVTINGVYACSQGVVHNTVVACAVGDTTIAVPPSAFDPVSGVASIAYSASASVTVAAIYL